MAFFSLAFMILFVFVFVIALLMYLLNAYGLYQLSKYFQVPSPGLSFVPIAEKYNIGLIVFGNEDYKCHILWMLMLLSVVLSKFEYLSAIIAFLAYLLILFCTFQIAKSIGCSGVIQTILTAFGFGAFVYFYMGLLVKNRTAVSEPILSNHQEVPPSASEYSSDPDDNIVN